MYRVLAIRYSLPPAGSNLLIGEEEVDALALLGTTGFDFALKKDPNMFACLACTASSFTFSSSFFFSSASRALDISFLRGTCLSKLTLSSLPFLPFLLPALPSSVERLLPACQRKLHVKQHTSSGVILDFFVGEALLLES
jgi:hypothetical protein